jgi:aerobic carbon-monoxide dehydrogenase medium subunit
MKPAPFEMLRPLEFDEALAMLSEEPEESKLLAGGQSLIPMMNFRLARPARLIDINGIADLRGIAKQQNSVIIRACTRHVELERNNLGGPLGQLLRQAAGKVGHFPIRTRGTFGGSIAHCDAASEWCVVATLLDAQMTAQSLERGTRTMPGSNFFESVLTTALRPDEILTEITLPALDDTYRTGIAEYAKRKGDFGIILVAAAVQVLEGVVTEAKFCIGGVGPVPVRSPLAEQTCIGQSWCDDVLTAAAEAAAQEVDPPSDSHADAGYRRALVRALLPRALKHRRNPL